MIHYTLGVECRENDTDNQSHDEHIFLPSSFERHTTPESVCLVGWLVVSLSCKIESSLLVLLVQ